MGEDILVLNSTAGDALRPGRLAAAYDLLSECVHVRAGGGGRGRGDHVHGARRLAGKRCDLRSAEHRRHQHCERLLTHCCRAN